MSSKQSGARGQGEDQAKSTSYATRGMLCLVMEDGQRQRVEELFYMCDVLFTQGFYQTALQLLSKLKLLSH